jgi:hypothetical protein
LILGGYDASRFKNTPGNSTFRFDPDDARWTSVGISSIFATNTLSEPSVSLSLAPINALIDTSTSYIWLPREACDTFEVEFGLTWEPNRELYLVNDTIHERLKTLNPTITFKLGNNNDSTITTNINLPYAAFDLQIGWPYYNDTRNYFPIKRAANSSQYTLGRTFLQEAYMVTDFSRGHFSIQQARFEDTMPEPDIRTLPQALYGTNSTTPPFIPKANETEKHAGLSKGAIAGIVLGLLVGVILLLALVLLLLRRKRRTNETESSIARANVKNSLHTNGDTKTELDGANVHEAPHYHPEVAGSNVQYESDSNALHLISDDAGGRHPSPRDREVHEMPGR